MVLGHQCDGVRAWCMRQTKILGSISSSCSKVSRRRYPLQELSHRLELIVESRSHRYESFQSRYRERILNLALPVTPNQNPDIFRCSLTPHATLKWWKCSTRNGWGWQRRICRFWTFVVRLHNWHGAVTRTKNFRPVSGSCSDLSSVGW